MNSYREPIKNWFGFTRRERRSASILLLIIIMIIALRFIVPERNLTIEDITTSVSYIGNPTGFLCEDISSTGQPFLFDHNKPSCDKLIKLGFAEKETNTLIKYRHKGGKSRQPVDLKKVYGIDEEQSAKFIPFVEVANSTSGKAKTNTHQQQKVLLDINICDSASLVGLPGIGPVLSARIIKYRHLLGGFASVNQLKEVYGLSLETFDLIKGRVFSDSSTIIRININSAGYKELSRLPYFEKYEVTAILKYRKLLGRVNSMDDLIENKLITLEKADNIRPYLRFE